MLLMKHIKEKEVISNSFTDIFILGKDYFTTEEGRSFLISVITYLFKTTEIDSMRIANTLENIIYGGGNLIMTTAMKLEQRGELRGELRGIILGEKNAELITASKMLKDGFNVKSISKYTSLTMEEINNINK